MDPTRPEPWIAAGSALGAGIAVKTLAPETSGAARPWLIASTVLLAAGVALFVVLLRTITRTPRPTLQDTSTDADAPTSTNARAALRRPIFGTAALAAAGLLAWSAGAPTAVLVPAALIVGGAAVMLLVRDAWLH